MINRKIISCVLVLCCCLLTTTALCETWSGTVTCSKGIDVVSPAAGILESLSLHVGDIVKEGTIVGKIQDTPVFATQDGKVSLLLGTAGTYSDGPVLSITPISPYKIVSSVSEAYNSVETSVVHIGETVYIRCTADRSHKAIGIITSIDGTNYDVLTIAGELYIGEVVNLYRDPVYSYSLKIGSGTVTTQTDESYDATGWIRDLRVKQGDQVEKGQLLFVYNADEISELILPTSGIVTEVNVSIGSTVNRDSVIAVIAPASAIQISFEVESKDVNMFQTGDTIYYLRPDDPKDALNKAVITSVSAIDNSGKFTITAKPEKNAPPIGMNVIISDSAEV